MLAYLLALADFQERELRELRQQLEASQTEARLLRGRLAAREEEALQRDAEVKAEKVKSIN